LYLINSGLKDEKRSGLNGILAAAIRDGSWDVSKINMVEVNNVCDGGPELLAELRAHTGGHRRRRVKTN